MEMTTSQARVSAWQHSKDESILKSRDQKAVELLTGSVSLLGMNVHISCPQEGVMIFGLFTSRICC